MKKGFLIALGILAVIQLIRIDKTNLSIDPKQEYVTVTQTPKEVENILKRACYDCHSDEVKYPWYTNIAPISWYIKGHINQGREYLNFSKYGKYNSYQIEHILTSLPSVIEKETMPLNSYTWIHKEAILSPKDRKILVEWFISFLPKDSKE